MPAGETVERPEDDQSENEPTNLMPSTPERDAEMQEWCLLPKVALPFAHLDTSDGNIRPLTVDEMEELKFHIQSGHLTKSHLFNAAFLKTFLHIDEATTTL